METNQELRARARQELGGSLFHTNWLTALAICLVGSIISSFFPLILAGPIGVGLARAILAKVRGGEKFVFEDLFSGFDQFGENLMIGLMQGLIVFAWSLIPIAGIYFGIKKGYSFAMAYYVKNDHPEADWRECLDRSTLLMEGHRWELFCLEFSFIGWILLGMFTCGIGLFWVDPYQKVSVTCFYEKLRSNNPNA